MRFLHTADWQLGMTRHFLDADAQSRFTSARTEAIVRIGAVAAAEGCEFIVVSGDVFEANTLPARVVARALEALRLVPVPLYLLPGNHDPLEASSVYDSKAFLRALPEHVHVLREPGITHVRDGVEIIATPWTSKHPTSDPVADGVAGLEPDGTLRIVVGHGATDTLSPNPLDPALIRVEPLRALLRAGAIHYVALGDRHSLTEVDPAGIYYSGAPEVTDFIEVDPGKVLVVDCEDGRPARTTAHVVGTWSFLDLSFDVNGAADVAVVDETLDAMGDKSLTVLRVSLRGTLSLQEHAELESVLDRHAETFAALNRWERHTDLALYVDGDELTELGVGGFVQDGVDEIAALAGDDGPDADTARDALALLFRLAGGVR
ncbi:MAG: exonuclease SbcCD subunit D [Actinomycetales bacterium]|nr:exonuclease SbcCD subunit D [Actinomycetales bacterium]